MKVHLLQALLLTLNLFFPTYFSHQIPLTFCGKIPIQTPFSLQNSSQTLPLNQMVLCKSHKLYFRTSIGLFPISSIDNKAKHLTISHKSFSSSSRFISPSNLSAGFPIPPIPNSLFLLNCSNERKIRTSSTFLRNCPLGGEGNLRGFSCLVVDDVGKLDMGFHPGDLNCSHYRRVYRKHGLIEEKEDEFELGTRISFDVPGHVPNPCDECEKANGNCGVGLKCICHPQECRDKVISMGAKMEPMGSKILFSLLSSIVLMDLFMGY
ncbi:hypothetical protein LguiB_001139 [Lonicera macranthoides]